MTDEDFAKLRSIVARELGLPESDITPDSSWTSLGADSLEAMQLLIEIEDAFGTEVQGHPLTLRQVLEQVGHA